jgi:hypothetical protein
VSDRLEHTGTHTPSRQSKPLLDSSDRSTTSRDRWIRGGAGSYLYTCSGAHAGVSRVGGRPHRRRRGGSVDLGGAGGRSGEGIDKGPTGCRAPGGPGRGRAVRLSRPRAHHPGLDGLVWWGWFCRGATRHGMASAPCAAAAGCAAGSGRRAGGLAPVPSGRGVVALVHARGGSGEPAWWSS